MEIKIPWGKEDFLELNLPDNWNILSLGEPKFLSELDPKKEIKEKLKNPTSSPSLRDMVKDKNRVLIVVDDISRETPAHLFIEEIIEELKNANIKKENIIVLTAPGLHREMTAEEIKSKVGKKIFEEIKCLNHNCYDKNSLRYFGKTKHNTPIYLNKIVGEIDLIILVGTIEPHAHAGFGGGAKNILPGISGYETIAKNHSLGLGKSTLIGTDPEENIMRQDVEETIKLINKPMFLVNTILNHNLKIVKILTGDVILAHREGIKFAREIYEIKVKRRADIIITNSYPFDINLRQSVKCVGNCLSGVKDGGCIVAIMKCYEGIGDAKLPKIKLPQNMYFLKIFARLLLPLIKNFSFGNIVENRFLIYLALKIVVNNKIYIYAPEIPEKAREKFPIFANVVSPQVIIDNLKKYYKKPDVILLPYGGVTYPRVEK